MKEKDDMSLGSTASGNAETERHGEHWSVSVSVNGEEILTIAHNFLSGKTEFTNAEAQCIRDCARHLEAFIGPAVEPSNE